MTTIEKNSLSKKGLLKAYYVGRDSHRPQARQWWGNKVSWARPEGDNRDTVVDIPAETAEQVYCWQVYGKEEPKRNFKNICWCTERPRALGTIRVGQEQTFSRVRSNMSPHSQTISNNEGNIRQEPEDYPKKPSEAADLKHHGRQLRECSRAVIMELWKSIPNLSSGCFGFCILHYVQ